MALYVKVDENDNIVKFPYHQATFKIDNPGDWPETIDDEVLATHGVMRVREVPFPSHLAILCEMLVHKVFKFLDQDI